MPDVVSATAMPHPLTGELLNADDLEALASALEQTEAELRRRRERNRPIYDARDSLTARVAELRGPAELPRPSNRSSVQERVAICPRCRGRLAGSVVLTQVFYDELVARLGCALEELENLDENERTPMTDVIVRDGRATLEAA